MEKYYQKLGEFIFVFAICESYINQLIVFTNDLNDLPKGYKILGGHFYLL